MNNRLCLALLSLIVPLSASCKPKGVAGEESLSIDIGNLKQAEIGVLTPSKKFIFLRTNEFQCQGLSINDGQVLIDPSVSTGYYWDQDGRRNTVATFAERGVFAIYVSDNLETEPENSSAISKIYLNNEDRSKKIVPADSCGAAPLS